MNFSFKSIKYLLILPLVLACLTAAHTARAALEQLDSIAAVVNDEVVMMSELKDHVKQVEQNLKQQGTPLPPKAVLEKQVLDQLILQKLEIQEAKHTGIRVDDETLNATINNVAAQNKLTLTQFRNVLEKEHYSYKKFRQDMRNQILISRLEQRQVDNRVIVSDREIDNYLANQKHMGDTKTEYHLLHILIATPDGASADQLTAIRNKANKVLTELRAGKDFMKVAAKYSDSGKGGTDLGWLKAKQIPTLFTDFVADMSKGDISNLITGPSGYHIIKLVGIRSGEKYIVTQTHVRQILLKPDDLNTEADVKRRLEQLRTRIEGGASFSELAKGNSVDTMSAAEGGDLGWVNPGDLVPEFERVMNATKVGQISQPFRTRYGWHILQVLGRRKHDSSDDIRRAKAREAIRKRKLADARERWLRHMREDAYVEYRVKF